VKYEVDGFIKDGELKSMETMETQPLLKVYWPLLLLPVMIIVVWSWPTLPVILISSLVMSGAWMVSLFELQRSQRRWRASIEENGTDERQVVQQNHERQNAAIQQQLDQFRDELDQLLDLLATAIGGLLSSFTGLEEQSRNQEELVRGTLDCVTRDGKSGGISELTKEATTIIQLFVDSILAMRDSSNDLVSCLNEMREQIATVNKMLSEIDGISSQTNLLALNAAIEAARAGDAGRGFAVVADEVRALSQRSSHFSEKIREQYTQMQASMQIAGTVVGKMAARDMDMTLLSKDRITELMDEAELINRKVETQLQSVSLITENINQNVSTAVRSLQFEDMTRQLIEHMRHRVDAVQALLDGEDSQSEFSQDSKPRINANYSLHAVTGNAVSSAAKKPASEPVEAVGKKHKESPISQQDMASGDIELF